MKEHQERISNIYRREITKLSKIFRQEAKKPLNEISIAELFDTMRAKCPYFIKTLIDITRYKKKESNFHFFFVRKKIFLFFF